MSEKPGAQHRPAVAQVLADDQLALNIGDRHGVRLGQRYLVYTAGEDEIIDPTTGESLGTVEIPKGTGRIVGVQAKLSVLESDTEPSQRNRARDFILSTSSKAPFRNPKVGDSVKQAL